MVRLTFLLGLLLSLAGACGGHSARPQPAPSPAASASGSSPLGPDLVALTFKSPSGQQSELRVRVEASGPAREKGLMNVAKLPDNEGDLFMWPDVAPNQDVAAPFWMQDTLIPLTIAFISANGQILEEQDMMAQTRTLHIPHEPYRFAVEANEGWYAKHGLIPGSTVNLPAAVQAFLPH